MLVSGLVVGLVVGLTHAKDIDLTVDLGYAKYRGANAKNGVSTWFGMRYAAPPLGDLRWRAPQDPLVNTTLQPATARGGVCISSPSTSISDDVKNGVQKEDCLFVNVFAPTVTKGNHPVFVNFQGGGLNSLADSTLDANNLINAADRDIVVVTSNYRVGLQGFLASKEVQANGEANAGLLDQRKVLHWVQKNIHLFGGDPKHVTIGGASAGGASVSLQLTAYDGRDDGLFHAAAGESASLGAKYTIAEAQYQYDALIKRVKCDTAPDTLKCLRDLDINTLILNNPNIPTPGPGLGNPIFPWSSVIDGNFTTGYSYNLYATGKFVKVPTIYGSCTNEGSGFTNKDPAAFANVTQMNAFLKTNYPKLTPEQLARADSLYPATPDTQFPNRGVYWRPAALAWGEMRYNCPGIYMSGAIPRVGGMNSSWNYHWDKLSTANALNGDGVTHVSEAPYIWGENNADDVAGNAIQSYWASFIRTKDPNKLKAKTVPEWVEHFEGDTSKGALQRVHFTNATVAMETITPAEMERCYSWIGIGSTISQ